MKINELIKVGECTEEYVVIIPAEYDDEGNVLEEHTEKRTRTVPIMESVTRDMTPEEEAEYNIPITAEERIEQLKQLLALSDYKAIKYAEGLISEEEYAPIKAQREAWREEIRRWENDS